MTDPEHRSMLDEEFTRAAATFTERTRGRFDELDVVTFSRVASGATVAEIGAGTGHFLSRFTSVAGRTVAIDLSPAMLHRARFENPGMAAAVADGAQLPLRDRSVDLIASAQMFHHVHQPVPILMEMRRVVAEDGHVLVVDQVATEKFEEARAMNELDVLRDPSHAASRPPSALRMMVMAAGLEIVAERTHESEQRLSSWMWTGEFPEERIAAVRRFIEVRGHETGKDFRKEGDDWVFTRRRLMILARAVN